MRVLLFSIEYGLPLSMDYIRLHSEQMIYQVRYTVIVWTFYQGHTCTHDPGSTDSTFNYELPNIFRLKGCKYLSSTGVAIRLMTITVGAWQCDPRDAIANPHIITVVPVNETLAYIRL